MATPMTSVQFKTILVNEGLTVVEYGSWATHNRNHVGAWGPTNGVMIHHTAGVFPGLVDYIYNGDANLPGPLAQASITKDGVVHLTGWGRANHAGSGDSNVLSAVIAENYGAAPPPPTQNNTDGNIYFIGFECENLGDGVDPYPPVQLAAMKAAAAAVCRFYGWSAKSTIGHKEWTNQKIDPVFSMPDFRTDVQTLLSSPAPGPVDPDPNPPPVATPEFGSPATTYGVYDDGSVETVIMRGSGVSTVLASRPGHVALKAEYDSALASVNTALAANRNALAATQNTNTQTDYNNLVASGVPDVTARRVSGYTGP